MIPERWESIKNLFEAALDRQSQERQEFLAGACEGDETLLAEVTTLLEGNKRVGSFLERPLFKPRTDSNEPSGEQQTIADFHIIKLLGSGRMGRVYEAYETSMRRKVALKVLNAGLANLRDDVSRFEREAWIGGRLSHSNIVKAYSQGEVSGIRYISMELIDGPSLARDILTTKAEFATGVDAKTRNTAFEK